MEEFVASTCSGSAVRGARCGVQSGHHLDLHPTCDAQPTPGKEVGDRCSRRNLNA